MGSYQPRGGGQADEGCLEHSSGEAREGDIWVKKSEVQQYRWLSVSRSLVDLGRPFASFS